MHKGSAEPTASTYTFSSQPKPVNARKKYREPGESDATMYRDPKETNIHWDKRVHRGNTYGMYTQNAIKEAIDLSMKEAMMPPVRLRQKRQTEETPFTTAMPEPERVPVDLTSNLVAPEVVVESATLETQTDEFLPQPPPDQYEPQKVGIDCSTQVEDGELFNFDEEVEPILDVIVNKTLEQSVMEVEEEFELESMKTFKSEWYERQGNMMADWDVQVAAEKELWKKKGEVVVKMRETKEREARVLLKIQAMAAAKAHLRDVVPNAVQDLKEVAFPDMRGMAIDRLFLPGLMEQVAKRVQTQTTADSQINDMVRSCMRAETEKQATLVQGFTQKRIEIQKRRYEDAQIRQGTIRIYVDDGAGGKVPIGPIQISSDSSVDQVQDTIYEWLKVNEPKLAQNWEFGVTLCLNDEPCQSVAEIFEAKSGMISMVPKPEPVPEETAAEEPVDEAAQEDAGDAA